MTKQLWATLLLLSLGCSFGDFELVGTDTDTGEMTGIVVGHDRVPVDGGKVILRNADSLLCLGLPAACTTANAGPTRTVCDTTSTDPHGRFSFAGISRGSYWLEAQSPDGMGAVAEAQISRGSTPDTVDTIVLAIPGSTQGTVHPPLPAGTIAYVVLLELARAVPVDSASWFFLDSVPPGAYRLVLVSGSGDTISHGDTAKVEVTGNDTVTLPRINATAFARSPSAVLHLTFDDTTSDTIRDESPSEFEIRKNGACDYVPAPFGHGVELDGIQEYLEIPEWAFPGEHTKYEFSIRVKFDTIINDITANREAMCELINDAHWEFGRRGFVLRVTDRMPQICIGTADTARSSLSTWLCATDSTHTVEFGRWLTIRGVIDLEEQIVGVALDDHPLVTAPLPEGSSYNPSLLGFVRIGALAQGAARFLDGAIDEIRVLGY
jgi:hypothetical protein